MVKASSLRSGSNPELLKKAGAGLLALVLLLGLGFGIYGTFGGSSGQEVVQATSTTVSENIAQAIAKRQYPIAQPQAVPTNFVRTNVEIAGKTRSKSGCEEILQNYQGTSDPDIAYIDIYSYAAECSYPRPVDAEAFNVGDYSGWISDPDATATTADDSSSLLLEITVNKALVRVETDLPLEQIKSTLEKFVPFSTTPPKDSIKISIS